MNNLIDVVIVTYNSAAIIAKCLDQLNSKNISTILVVDNASQDNSVDVLSESAACSKIRLIRNESNLGFAKAVSVGVSNSRSDYILILNPDCEVTDPFLENVIWCHRDGADVVVPKSTFNEDGESLDGLVMNPTRAKIAVQVFMYQFRKKIPSVCHSLLGVCLLGLPLIEKISRYREKKNSMQWYWPNGACFSITKTMYERAGGLPQHYFMYNEDVEFGFHLTQKNCRYAITQDSLFHAFRKGSAISNDSRMELILSAHQTYLARVKDRFV